jgi:hypothetical protein
MLKIKNTSIYYIVFCYDLNYNPQPSTLGLASGDSQLVTLGPGTYRVFDQSAFGFAAIFLADCI